MRTIALALAFVITGCSTLNVLKGPDDFCRQMHADYRAFFDDAIAREIRKAPPNGALTKPYSRELWNKYWNDRIYYMYNVGPGDCGGTYRGPSGKEMLEYALEKRRNASLPDIELEARNSGKEL